MNRLRTTLVAILCAALLMSLAVAGVLAAVFESRDDSYVTEMNTKLTVPAPGVLLNDGESSGAGLAVLSMVSGPAHGTAVLNGDGSFEYTPADGYLGSDSFSYEAYDGEGSVGNVAVVMLSVVEPTQDPPPDDPACETVTKFGGSLKGDGPTFVNGGGKLNVQVTVRCDGHVAGLAPLLELYRGTPAADGSSTPDSANVMREDQGKYTYTLRLPSDVSAGDRLTLVVRPEGAGTAGVSTALEVRR